MKAVGYVRVSTENQAVEGVSVDAQRARIESWCACHEYGLLGVHTDAGLSGGRASNRPALQKALDEACRERAALVVYSLSRLARSTRDALDIAERLDRSKADLVSLSERIDTTTASGKMVFRMLAVLAEFERDQISERTTAAMAHLRAQGRRISGRVPFGFDLAEDGINLVENPAERQAIALMSGLREKGRSLRQIAAALDAKGIGTKTGAPWSAQAVSNILNRKGSEAHGQGRQAT